MSVWCGHSCPRLSIVRKVWRGCPRPRLSVQSNQLAVNFIGMDSRAQQSSKAATVEAQASSPVQNPTSCLLSIQKVAKIFGKHPVLRDISLEVAAGEFLTILGESGSGKTTLLRIIAGFEHPTADEVWR